MSAKDSNGRAAGVIIPFRSRDQVAPQTRSFSSERLRYAWCASAPMRIEGSVTLLQLFNGLRAAGLDYRWDKRTNEFVVMPIAERQS
jgi:hypothetical protein